MESHSVAVLHTTSITIPLMNQLIGEQLPGYQVLNFMDDSILPALNQNPGELPYIMEKLTAYICFAERQGAEAVLSACSSIGDIVDFAHDRTRLLVMRVDEAMMEHAATLGRPVLLCATLATTLEPSLRLLLKKCGDQMRVESLLLSEAYSLLQSDGKEAHDYAIARQLEEPMRAGMTIVLAQASMAAAAKYMPQGLKGVMLTSPQSGVALFAQKVKGNA